MYADPFEKNKATGDRCGEDIVSGSLSPQCTPNTILKICHIGDPSYKYVFIFRTLSGLLYEIAPTPMGKKNRKHPLRRKKQ